MVWTGQRATRQDIRNASLTSVRCGSGPAPDTHTMTHGGFQHCWKAEVLLLKSMFPAISAAFLWPRFVTWFQLLMRMVSTEASLAGGGRASLAHLGSATKKKDSQMTPPGADMRWRSGRQRCEEVSKQITTCALTVMKGLFLSALPWWEVTVGRIITRVANLGSATTEGGRLLF